MPLAANLHERRKLFCGEWALDDAAGLKPNPFDEHLSAERGDALDLDELREQTLGLGIEIGRAVPKEFGSKLLSRFFGSFAATDEVRVAFCLGHHRDHMFRSGRRWRCGLRRWGCGR